MVSCVVALLMLAPVAGRAASSREAAQAIKEGAERYAQGDYRHALAAYQRAYLNDVDNPRLLENIADCYRALEHRSDAVRFYKMYLHELPKAPDKAVVQATVALLEHPAAKPAEPKGEHPAPAVTSSAPATQAGSPGSTEPPPPPPPAMVVRPELTARPAHKATPVYKKWWLWTAVGAVVVVGLGVGLGVGLSSSPAASGSFTPTLPPFGPRVGALRSF